MSGFCLTIVLFSYAALRFTLGGRTYLDGDSVSITDIGEGDDAALLCVTDSTDCCGSPHFVGEFYYPDGNRVSVRASGDSLYRNRGDGFIRLNRKNGALSPLGTFRCDIPDSQGVLQSIYINVGELNNYYILMSVSHCISHGPSVVVLEIPEGRIHVKYLKVKHMENLAISNCGWSILVLKTVLVSY